MRAKFLRFALLTIGLAAAGQHEAFADAATEAQLRAALQSSTAQIAQLEDQVANLQAAQAPDVAIIEALRAQLQAGKSSVAAPNAADQAKNDAAMAALKRELAAQESALGRSQTAYQAASSAAVSAATANTALTSQVGGLEAGLSSCHTKNAELFTLSNQILDAYSHKDDLFGSIASREPFTGIKRVQLENIVQDDQDKIYDNQIAPNAATP